MMDPMSPLSAVHHLRTENESVAAELLQMRLLSRLLGEDSSHLLSPEKHRVCGPMPPPLLASFTALQGGDVWDIP